MEEKWFRKIHTTAKFEINRDIRFNKPDYPLREKYCSDRIINYILKMIYSDILAEQKPDLYQKNYPMH